MLTTTNGIMFVLSSPSGVGKTTLAKKIEKNNSNFVISISHTTRKPSYGTLKEPVLKFLSAGKDVMFDIDWQGTQQLKKIKDLSLVTFFVLPPNIKVLKKRLLNRHKKQEKLIEERMNKFNEEISHWKEYNYVVINDDLETCYNEILEIIINEKKGINQTQNMDEIAKKVGKLIK